MRRSLDWAPPAVPNNNCASLDDCVEELRGLGTYAIILYKEDLGIVREAYADGITNTTPLYGWSMTKTLAATMLGLRVSSGHMKLNEIVAGVPEGEASHEELVQRNVTADALMRMHIGNPQQVAQTPLTFQTSGSLTLDSPT